MSDIEGKAAREAASERSRGDASDIDGQNREVEIGGSTRVSVGNERVSIGRISQLIKRPIVTDDFCEIAAGRSRKQTAFMRREFPTLRKRRGHSRRADCLAIYCDRTDQSQPSMALS